MESIEPGNQRANRFSPWEWINPSDRRSSRIRLTVLRLSDGNLAIKSSIERPGAEPKKDWDSGRWGEREMGEREMGEREMGEREMGEREMGEREMGESGRWGEREIGKMTDRGLTAKVRRPQLGGTWCRSRLRG